MQNKEQTKVLQVLNSLGRGGIESLVLSLAREIDADFVKFDYAIMEGKDTAYVDEVKSMGAQVYIYPRLTVHSFFNFVFWWKRFFDEHQDYDVVHGHVFTTASLYLPFAKKIGTHTIVHSHNTRFSTKGKGIINWCCRKVLLAPLKKAKWIDKRMACSKAAGEWLFGKYSDFQVVNNGIEIDKFMFDQSIRDTMRAELGLTNRLVLGHVGNGMDAKNHIFLLEIFKRAHEKMPDSSLLLIGKLGSKESKIRDYIYENNLGDAVKILGVRNDVSKLMMAMDIFVFPSTYEGLGIVLIEAQAAGLPCIVSSMIPAEAKVSNIYEICKLEDGAQEWVKKILQMKEVLSNSERFNGHDSVLHAGYDIHDVAIKMQNYYLSCSTNNNRKN